MGHDSDGDQYSLIIWEYGKAGYVLSSSSEKVGFGSGNSGQTDIRYVEPDKAFAWCKAKNPGFGEVQLTPCYLYTIPANTVSVTAPGVDPVNAEWYAHSHTADGPETYQPRKPKPTATAQP